MAGFSRDVLADGVIENVQEMIRRGDGAPGEMLPSHRELAARFGVSLSTVREAMKALSLIGLVEVRPGRGTRVTPEALQVLCDMAPTQANLRRPRVAEVYEARAIIEVALTRLAAERATPADLAEIEGALAEMRATMDDDEAFVRADMRYHLAVARAGKNNVLEQFYYLTRSLLLETIRKAVALPGVKEESVALQAEILNRIKAHDLDGAQVASEHHMSYTADLLAEMSHYYEGER